MVRRLFSLWLYLWLYLCLLLLLGWASSAPAQSIERESWDQEPVNSAASTPANNMGLNIGPPLDYTTNRPFADVMKTSRDWRAGNNPAAVDALGWPTQDASIVVWAGLDHMQGTYRLSFTGKASVATGFGNASITNKSYDTASNTTTANLIYNSTDGSGLQLTFTSTQRTAASATNTGVTNVRLMRPRTVGGNTPYTTEIFTDQFKTVLGKFSTLRTMDFSATNANLATNWSDRTVPADASQSVGNPNGQPPPWEGRGAAWEYMVELANETGKDLWINVPERATDDYVNKLALLCKYGSDGINPYTGPQANPAWPPLNSNLKLYVEFSNEVWNTAGSFEQSQDNHNSAIAEVHAGGSPLNFDTDTNDWNWAWRRVAKRIVEISNAFRSVFGDADMMTRVRPVLMSQLGYADGPLLQEMHLMQDYYNNPANVGTPRPPSYYVYGIGGSAYYNPADKSSVNQIFATMASGFASDLQADANWALAFGVKRIAYEGGPSLDSTGNSTQDANQAAAWIDPRMKQVVIDEQNLWSQNAGDLLVYFQIAGDYQWGFTDDVLNLSHPKMQAIDALNSVAAAPSTYGTPIPATIAASTYAIPPTWFDGAGATLASRRWRGYPVSVSAANAFSVVLNVAANASGAQAEVFMDGQSLGVLAIPNTGSTSNFTDTAALVTANLAPGSHGTMVRNVTGSFVLNQIKVQAVTLTGSTTTISSNNNPSTAGQAVTFTASVTPANVTGTVQFKDGNTNLGAPIASSNGTATLTTSALSVATHAITASYSGDGGFLPSSSAALSQVVTAAGPISTSTALTLNPSKVIFFHQRAPWSLTVAVSATSTPDGSVVFMDGTRQLATKTLDGSGTASYSAPLRPGMHSIHAVYMGNSNFSGSSSSTQVVNVSPRPKPR